MDRGAWQATVHRVIKSQTQLKQLSARARTHTHTHTHTQGFWCSPGNKKRRPEIIFGDSYINISIFFTTI